MDNQTIFGVITRVRYDSERRFITLLEVWFPDREGRISKAESLSREKVVNLMRHVEFITMYIPKGQTEYQVGATVRVTRNGFLRTDSNNIAADNLENLPEF